MPLAAWSMAPHPLVAVSPFYRMRYHPQEESTTVRTEK